MTNDGHSAYATESGDNADIPPLNEESLSHSGPARNMLSPVRMGAWELALDTATVKPSRSLEELCGFPPQEQRPLSSYLSLVHPEDRFPLEDYLQSPPPQFQVEIRLRPQGTPTFIWLAVQGERRTNRAGTITGILGVSSDISALKQAERLVRSQTLELGARIRELDCLYKVSRIIQRQESLPTLLAEVVQAIPGGFSDPTQVGVRIVWEHDVFTTDSFKPGISVLSEELVAQGQVVGSLEVHRTEESFSYAEQALVQSLTKSLSRAIEHNRILAALRESEDRWRTLAGALAEGVVLLDKHGHIEAWNANAERLLGLPLFRGGSYDCAEGRAVREDGSPLSSTELPAILSLRNGTPYDDVVIGLRHDDGTLGWVSTSTRPLFHTGEDKPYGVVASFADITERKRTEEAIRSEIAAKELERNRLNTVLEALPVAVFIADAQGRLIQLNAAAEKLWGKAVLSDTPDRYHQDYRAWWPDTGEPVKTHEWGLARAIRTGESVKAEEMEILRYDGERRTILNYALPFYGKDGLIAGGVAVSVDITERKASEAERALLAAIVKASPDAIVSTDMRGRITSWNAGAERLYGYTEEEIVGKSITELMPAEHKDELGMILTAIAEGKNVMYFDSSRIHKNGELVDVSVAVVPVTDDAGRVIGAAKIDRDISDRKRMELQLQHEALHDRLTGAANRSLFVDRLDHIVSRATRSGEHYAVFVMDMDNFKLINDTYGHQVGDELLTAFAKRIQNLLRPVDTLARFGGDEFTLLLTEVEDKSTVKQVAERILEALQHPFRLSGQEIIVSSSIGIMLSDPSCHSGDHALRNADVALYEAKRQGKNQYVVFDARMRGQEVSRLYLESELRRALQEVGLKVQYQPIVDVHTEKPVGCEALARWRHPVMGSVDPSRFINVAEETGLITSIGRFILERACAALADWRHEHSFPTDFYVSVNMSPKEFYAKDLVPFIDDMLQNINSPAAICGWKLPKTSLSATTAKPRPSCTNCGRWASTPVWTTSVRVIPR
ncbi:hypothetical protein CAI21_15150 [Alkalilimnicola ehrlichii]|uniref:PAS domain S-box protein n=1 Tax=Alkalilimnicola ehrlichii TaxID=351052 RepID=A0A3E0WR94_9GAMM|nr:PAS domain S-box protein [Alkalilimnicola ehrlichii]RFA27185.1 hypothetical protein CAI21_15150 [Alkalilimnicola ehrlichii]RFA35358.1 hypothetical protein CAL65_12805 [Alkalilimnicola ehrlichii]